MVITARVMQMSWQGQGYYIATDSPESAWEEMALRFPEETATGFTVQDWEGFDVVINQVDLRSAR